MLDPFDRGDIRSSMDRIKKILANTQGDIEVERVVFTLDVPSWRSFRTKNLQPHATKAEKALSAGKLDEAHSAMTEILRVMDERFGRFAPRIVTYDEIATLRDILRRVSGTKGALTPAGVSCDRARDDYRSNYHGQFWNTEDGHARLDVGAMLASLFQCATRHYTQVAGGKPESADARAAVARLVGLLGDPGWDEFNSSRRDTFQKRADKLREEWGLSGTDEPL